MSPGFYIAHVPLKYFHDISLDLFPGKLIRARVISADGQRIRFELGGATLEATSKRIYQKGDSITLRVKAIGSKGVSLEIVEGKVAKASSKLEQISVEKDTRIKELYEFRESINKLLKSESTSERVTNEKALADSIKTLLKASDKHDFFFLAFPLKLADNKPRHLEMIMRKIKDESESEGTDIHEYVFSVSTARLGDICGRIYQVGKRLRIDLTASLATAIDELKSISEPMKKSITLMGFQITSLNIQKGETKGPLENLLMGDDL